ncbi:MAG TPA: hypothetical protein VFR17_04495 [Mycobacterium sp.]|nr:hypothetical protein [Mycobacterium sp.]
MRSVWRMLAFDIAAPLAGIAGLWLIGQVLAWPLWWVSAFSVLTLLVVEGVAVNFFLLRRDSVTVGTDDDRPGIRAAVAGLCTVALVAAAALAYTHWTVPDRNLERDSGEVVRIATAMAEAAATVSPTNPNESIERAASMMVPDRVDAFKEKIGHTVTEMAEHLITVQAQPLSAGVEAIGPAAARVAVLLRSTQTSADQQSRRTVAAVRVLLTKRDDRWQVLEISPIHVR